MDQHNQQPNIPAPIGESPAIYADGIAANVTAATITLDFTHHEPWLGLDVYRTLVKVQMSPVQFKALSELLPTMIKQYEDQFGEIHLPGIEIMANVTTGEADAREPEQ